MSKNKSSRINTVIRDGLIDEIVLFQNKPWWLRLDVLPFAALYLLSTALIVLPDLAEGLSHSSIDLKLTGLIVFPCVLVAHLVVFLYAQSSLSFRCLLGKTVYAAQELDTSTKIYVLVKAHHTAGSDRIVLLQRNEALLAAAQAANNARSPSLSVSPSPSSSVSVMGNLERKVLDVSYSLNAFTFTFQEVPYFLDIAKNAFSRLDYPTHISARTCLAWEGHSAQGSWSFAEQRWGLNDFNIPVPHFLDLYMEHLVAPFFVFQVLCLFLWSLDDYWYYSLFTLMMLLLFEGVMCNQRQNNVRMMKNMRRPAFVVFAYRRRAWVETQSDALVPGDIFSITADKPVTPEEKSRGRRDRREDVNFDGKVLPCDALLVRGHCVVNEAMLTGESVPKVKESLLENAETLSLAQAEESACVDITKHSGWSRHVLLGGTLVQQHGAGSNEEEEERENGALASSMARIPPPPDGGCVGIVLRTGFGTTQGELMRKILFSSETTGTTTTASNGSSSSSSSSSSTVSSSETVSFISLLVLCAVVAAAIVLIDGLQDESRNKFRLALHCIMIVTSVVPPELPMELSLAVTTSLAALSKQMIFCTEPFRIALAGKLDVLCFDKTGTLTKDEMVLKGVVAAQDINVFTGQSMDTIDGLDVIPSVGEVGEVATADAAVMISPEHTTDLVRCIMGTCHDLVQRIAFAHNTHGNNQENNGNNANNADLNILGDPLEFASFAASGFKFLLTPESSSHNTQAHNAQRGGGLAMNHVVNTSSQVVARVQQKYPFSSELKRMSVVATLSAIPPASSSSGYNSMNAGSPSSSSGRGGASKAAETASYVFCKGAPEVLQSLLKYVPSCYSAAYQTHMQAGKRVLALAYKPLPAPSHTQNNKQKKLSREDAEKDLLFAGFLVFDCDLKADSKSVIKELRGAAHRVVMITGDSVYTAANVSKRLAIIDAQRVPLVLHPIVNTDSQTDKEARTLVWRRLDSAVADHEAHVRQSEDVPFSLRETSALLTKHALCVTGDAFDVLHHTHGSKNGTHTTESITHTMQTLCPLVTVFARVSPAQKETILHALNGAGLYTLMCGDGTNDVGALKAAHVGVSIINNPRLENIVEETASRSQQAANANTSTKTGSSKKGGKTKSGTSKDRLARAMLELQAHESDPSIVKLGDASIASPFTAKRTSIDSVLTVIRQGRCTLVTTIQVYKVLALNCLACAFIMSAMYMKGLKQGDTQMTCSGLLLAALFFFLSQAKPIASISDARPPSSVFSRVVLFSIIGQFLVHLTCMQLAMVLCGQHSSADDFSLSPDGKFSPNLVNSSMFLLSIQILVNNFWVNYRGPPYMEELSSNIYFWRVLQGVYLIILVIVGGQFEPINDLLQLVQFPTQEFQVQFLAILAANALLSYFIERGCRKLE